MTGPARIALRQPGPLLATGIVLLCAIGFGLTPFFARGLAEAGLSSGAIAFYRYAFSLAVLAPFLPVARGKRQEGLLALGAGAAMGLGWIGYLEAVKVAPVAAAGTIYMSYPLFAILLAWPLAGQRPGGRALAAGLLVLAGAALALSPPGLDAAQVRALLLSLSAPLTFGLGIVVLCTRLPNLAVLEKMSALLAGSALALAPLLATQPVAAVLPEDAGTWLLVAGVAGLTAFLPQLLYTYAAPMVGPARAAAAGSLELPTMLAIGWLQFGEAVGPAQIAATLLLVLAILLAPAIAPANRHGGSAPT